MVAKVHQEDRVSSQDKEATLFNRWDTARGIYGQIVVLPVFSHELVNYLDSVLYSSYFESRHNCPGVGTKVISPDGQDS
jgi:hypothetical protein